MRNFAADRENTPRHWAFTHKVRSLHKPCNRVRRLTGRLLSVAVAIFAAPSVYAACTPTITQACLANQPIQSASSVKPNVMFILDNSGSMGFDYMPDSATSTGNCRKNYQYNTIYYNPNFNYTAAVPRNAMNVSMGSQSWPSAQTNPFASTATVNLSTSFQAHSLDTLQAAYYYKYSGTITPGVCPTTGTWTKVTVSATSCTVSGDVKSCPTGADERVNFANWYSYYRTRMHMMKSGMATAFATIDDQFRVGFHTINNPASTGTSGGSLNITDFSGGGTGTPKGNWYAMLFKMAPGGGTPLQQALHRVGQYYSGSPAANSGLSGDPLQYSCQKNYAILSTDGGWNGANTGLGNWDKTVPAAMPVRSGSTTYDATATGLTQGAQMPRPYYEGSTANSDTLADVAMYYWIRDLRTSGTLGVNNVPTSPADLAYWQHMNTYTIGLGLDGHLNYPDDFDGLVSGAKNWPVTPSGGNTNTNDISKFDDLWHAAVNGRGQYYKATDPTTLANSLNSALLAISATPSYGVGPTSSTNNFRPPDQDDFTTYVTSYKVSDWTGDVNKYKLDRTTGLQTGASLWSASKRLDLKVNPGQTAAVDASAYMSRNIVTRHTDGTPIAFTYADLSTAQQTALCYKITPGIGPCIAGDASLVNYLRGDGAYEGNYGVGGARYRNRHDTTEKTYHKRNLLGPSINAQPVYVAVESRTYQDATDPGYSTFRNGTKTRNKVLYVPANDGMVHAFDAATGDELWAYIPSFLIAQTNDENGKEKGLRALSYQHGGAPAYVQHYYIDATPELAAVDFNRAGVDIATLPANTASDWRNILVGGLGKGGKGYYALDVTTPATTLEQAKTKVLWEFPSASDSSHADVITGGQMGYSYGKPIIAKTLKHGWVVIVSSGHNNTDNYGYIFILNPKTGKLLETLTTKSLATPRLAHGMAHLRFIANSSNKYVNEVYAGDLYGSLWRFDLNATPPAPQISQLFTSSSATPISAEVDMAIDGNTGVRWIFFGTGQYLDIGDRSTTATQYLVALRDGTANSTKTWSSPANFASLTTVANLTTGLSAIPATGWKYVLTTSKERVAVKPITDLQTVVFISTIPTDDACSPGINSRVYALDYSTGVTRFRDANNLPVPSRLYPGSITNVSFQGTSVGGKLKVCKDDGTCESEKLPPIKNSSATRHVGWREVIDEY